MPKKQVKCSWCDSQLMRYEINPNTGKPIQNFFCDNLCKGEWQIRQRELKGFTKEWLYDEYIVKGKNANQIAKEIGRDGKRVWEWLKLYDIPTRSRGDNYKENLIFDGSTFLGKKHTKETRERIRQISLEDGRVPYLRNGVHWLHTKGAKHPSWKGGITPERQAFYASQEWVDAVKKVWHRDNATCQRCGKHHNTAKNRGTFHIHHIVSFQAKELRSEVNNLILLCKECHYWVHSNANTQKSFIKEIKNGKTETGSY